METKTRQKYRFIISYYDDTSILKGQVIEEYTWHGMLCKVNVPSDKIVGIVKKEL